MYTDLRNDRYRDLAGLIYTAIVFLYPVFALCTSIVFGFLQSGPLYILFPQLVLIESPVYMIIRQIYYFLLFQWTLFNGRTCTLLTTGMGVSFLRLLRIQKSNRVYSPKSLNVLLNLYRELGLVLSLLSRHTHTMIGIVLMGCYIIIVAGPCYSVLLFRRDVPSFALALSGTASIAFCSVLFVFKIGNFMYSTSRFIVKQWQDGCKEWRNFEGHVLRRKVKSCQFLLLKAGDISIIDNRLAQGYFNALFLDCMNVLIISSAYWKTI